MSPKENSQGVWFGVAMFLFGLIAGVVLSVTTGTSTFSLGGPAKGTQSSAPSAPTAPTAPVANVNDRMLGYAKAIGLDTAKFTACVASGKYNEKINKEMAEGQKSGISGTPGNILYHIKTKNSRLVSGARPIDSFRKNIDEMLKDPASKSSDADVLPAKDVVPVDFEKDHILGDKDADIAIIEYTDFQCPFCHRVHPTHQQLVKEYDGKVMWVERHFPLNFHPEAVPLANGAECAAELGGNDAFWAFSDKVMGE